jgi:isoleucyl-tRNA synthetase
LAHYQVYEFHPVVAKLQVYCSEDLGAFYLDVLKDRLYTTAPGSRERRSAQTALHHITQALLRWMAPFLSFTAEEAWALIGHTPSIFTETYWAFDGVVDTADAELLQRWARIREVRELVNKEIEAIRVTGTVGSSLQATVTVTAPPSHHALLAELGDDLRFVLITSAATLVVGDALAVQVTPSTHTKCERCWHWRSDAGHDPAHPGLCGRCTSNLYGAGEPRRAA